MKAARIIEPDKPLELNQVEIADPSGTQVLIKVLSTGVCHSDLHLWEGGYDTGDGFMKVTDRGVKFPVTPGHEVVGTIEKIGESVQDVKIGDTVLVYPWIGCAKCPTCEKGDTNLCETPKSLGVFQDGGYAEKVIVPDYKFLANIGDVDPDSASSLACSGLTAYTAIKKALVNDPESILIVGAGGLGLMGVQIASHMAKCKIICADIDDEKLKTAKELGATDVVNTKESDASQKIMSICNEKGVDSIVDFVNAPPTVKLDLSVVRKRGNIILVGLFGGSVDLPLVSVPLKAITIQGAYTGNYKDMVELIELAKQGVINPIVSKHYTLDEATGALDDLKNRKILGRAVINP
ncbi:MAG: alcohol dehydrogenase [Thermoproteota archaeon]|nr:alcohol dehydrogenase [Thermoproteota archaeon]MED5282983.1 alcohol dehydrogenase [Thermoproteota archaeon]MED5542714.1 alcohol dehydrogenase [Thermoproteota archaeon]